MEELTNFEIRKNMKKKKMPTSRLKNPLKKVETVYLNPKFMKAPLDEDNPESEESFDHGMNLSSGKISPQLANVNR